MLEIQLPQIFMISRKEYKHPFLIFNKNQIQGNKK